MTEAILNQISTAAVACEQQTGAPAEVIAAQCALESGWLNHASQNNCFGIKSYPGEYGRQLLETTEYFTDPELAYFQRGDPARTARLKEPIQYGRLGSKLYIVEDWFATFPTLTACFVERGKMWDTGRYAIAACEYKHDHDEQKYVRAIAPIYATADPAQYDATMDKLMNELLPAVKAARAAEGEQAA